MKPSIACVLLVVSVLTVPSLAADAPDRYKPVLDRLESFAILPVADWRFHADVPHPEDPTLDVSAWETVKVDEKWSAGSRVFWRMIEIPDKLNGYSLQGASVKLDVTFDSDGPLMISVFSNGGLVYHGTDTSEQPVPLIQSAQPGQRIVLAIRLDATETPTRIQRSRLLIEAPSNRPSPNLLREEILVVRPMIAAYAEGKADREQQLDAAVKTIDFAPLDRDDQGAFDESLRSAQRKLESLNPWLKQFTIRAVGNSHIDMAWLWPWTETVEVVRNTFRSVLDLMREYPDFKFTMSSARTYEWIEEKYPDMFHEIEQRVMEGRWEIVGGMWVEPDLNMPAGESLTRQILIGKRYFQKKFGVDVKIGWNPDSFGYNWQLPQIYKKSGMDYFVTQKLLWAHEFTTFPYKLFWWEAPDGSRLLTYFPHDYASPIEAEGMAKDLSEWAPAIYGPRLTGAPEMMHLYGVGDHGGGPTRAMLDSATRLMAPNAVFPNLQFSTATAFFDDLRKKLPTMTVPTWKGELYFQYHRGVFTTQADTKQRIRRSEETLLDAEKFAALASLYGRPYPQEEMERAWKNLLFEHFHDIMPGSGIAVNYLDAKRKLEDVRRMGNEVMEGSLQEIASRVNTTGEGTPVLVVNSLSWQRTEVIEVDAQLPMPAKQIQVVDSAGNPTGSELLRIDPQNHRARFLLLVNVPAMGYSTYFVRAATAAPAPSRSSVVRATADSLENEFVRLKIDPQSGCVTSLFDKRGRTESLAPAESDTGGPHDVTCGNLLQAFYDKPKNWDAWNIDADFEKQHWDLDKADDVKLVEHGPLRAVIRVKKHFQHSTFVQDITMYTGVPRVDVKMHVDWHEKHILLKVAFPLAAHSAHATYEIPYGSVERPTGRSTPAEQGQFEVPGLQWADISDAQHGFSLLNDSKYGWDAKGNVLRLSLLRSPEWPDPHADEGEHDFTYSMYPHGGTWREALTVRRGDELNYQLFAMQTEKHDGALPPSHSFVQVGAENVVLTALKKAEDSDAIVLRFYEWAGSEGDVALQLPASARSASETDLMERSIADLPVKNETVTVHTKPYEIKTVKVSFARAQGVVLGRQPTGKLEVVLGEVELGAHGMNHAALEE
ncbi:MAG: alpha-mannosidase [Acidobacteriia bacterium]|nr:alpha-mannosidase [Terriglobia bacterium]